MKKNEKHTGVQDKTGLDTWYEKPIFPNPKQKERLKINSLYNKDDKRSDIDFAEPPPFDVASIFEGVVNARVQVYRCMIHDLLRTLWIHSDDGPEATIYIDGYKAEAVASSCCYAATVWFPDGATDTYLVNHEDGQDDVMRWAEDKIIDAYLNQITKDMADEAEKTIGKNVKRLY